MDTCGEPMLLCCCYRVKDSSVITRPMCYLMMPVFADSAKMPRMAGVTFFSLSGKLHSQSHTVDCAEWNAAPLHSRESESAWYPGHDGSNFSN